MVAVFRLRQDSIRLNADGTAVGVYSGGGAPSGAYGAEAVQVYFRNDAASASALQYLSRDTGTTWVASQALDAELTALAGLTSAADKVPYFTGSGTASVADFTSTGRDVVASLSTAAVRTIIGLVIGTDVPSQASSCSNVVADPGNAGAISVNKGGFVPLVTAAAETRTLAIPTVDGILLSLVLDTDGGDCVVTSAQAINVAGNTVITLDTIGDSIHLRACTVGGVRRWRVVGNDGTVLS